MYVPENSTLYQRNEKFHALNRSCVFCTSSSFAQNAIVTENQNPGTPASTWDIPTADAGDLSIQGYATDISVNKGATIGFKIDVNTVVAGSTDFNIDIYRLGYYQGNGARLIAHLAGPFTGISTKYNSPLLSRWYDCFN